MNKAKQRTWDEIQAEMSITGSPEKITQIGRDMEILLANVDQTNIAELDNALLVLEVLTIEINRQKKWEIKRQHP